MDNIYFSPELSPSIEVKTLLTSFLDSIKPYEVKLNIALPLFFDERSNSFYINCHLYGEVISKLSDFNASLDEDEEDIIYRLNRDITEDHAAYKMMQEDAKRGRSFEDIVLEYDKDYHKDKPLKVYSGQHRIQAIKKCVKEKGQILHGVRIYFGLNEDQKVEIATINNTAIVVPNDLIDRMREQLLGPELREWCQKIGLLEKDEDFSDRRSHDIPTVRIIRTLVVNFHKGKKIVDFDSHKIPYVCSSGGIDNEYLSLRSEIDWNFETFLEMGKQYSKLHRIQKEIVSSRDNENRAEFSRKALSYSVVASWGYAAGLFQNRPEYLEFLYGLTEENTFPNDPLNAKALSDARLKGTDPDTYRGLGTRSNNKELGRMLEVFIILAKTKKKSISKELANAAIKSYEAKKAKQDADKAIEKL